MTRHRTVSQIARLWRRILPSYLPCRIAQWMALMVLIGALTILGCSSSNSGSPFAAAIANDLTNRSFTFANGAGPDLAALLGLPQGQPFTLQFGNFRGSNVRPV